MGSDSLGAICGRVFWFVPALIVAASIGVALALIEVDSSGGKQWLAGWPRLFGVGAEGARGMLSAIAGSMMTVVGVTFSMTLMNSPGVFDCLSNPAVRGRVALL